MPKQQSIGFEYTEYLLEELGSEELRLIEAAKGALTHAYAPYSEFCVGAAVLLDNGQIVIGNNQENAAYPSGLCAERVALFHAGSNYPNEKILKLAVAARPKSADKLVQPGPCGGCRQVMLEYRSKQDAPIELLLICPNDKVLKMEVQDLLPLAFDKYALKKH